MGETQTPHFFGFGIFERVLTSQNQAFFFGDPRIPQIIQDETKPFLINRVVAIIESSGIQSLKIKKGGRRQIPTIRVIQPWKSWI